MKLKSSLADIDIGDKFKDEKGVLMEIVNFNGTQTVVYRPVGATGKNVEREMAKTPELLAKIRLQMLEEERGK
jgi:hypothetical protein